MSSPHTGTRGPRVGARRQLERIDGQPNVWCTAAVSPNPAHRLSLFQLAGASLTKAPPSHLLRAPAAWVEYLCEHTNAGSQEGAGSNSNIGTRPASYVLAPPGLHRRSGASCERAKRSSQRDPGLARTHAQGRRLREFKCGALRPAPLEPPTPETPQDHPYSAVATNLSYMRCRCLAGATQKGVVGATNAKQNAEPSIDLVSSEIPPQLHPFVVPFDEQASSPR